VNFAAQPTSKQWAALKYRGERFAEVWFKPEGEPAGLIFRIPRESFQIPGMDRQLTIGNLLKAIGLAPEDVESWRQGDRCHAGMAGANPEFRNVLLPPPADIPHWQIHVLVKQATPAPAESALEGEGTPSSPLAPGGRGVGGEGVACASVSPSPQPLSPEGRGALQGSPSPQPLSPEERGADHDTPSPQPSAPAEAAAPETVPDAEIPAGMWEDLDSRWKSILSLEASIDTLRGSMESLRAETEGALKKTLNMEEKLHAGRADLTHWTKEKKRAQDALPKLRDALHRSVWAVGAPERKRLEALYEDHIQPRVPFPRMAEVLKELEALQKTRQVLYSHGQTVYQETRAIVGSVHTALRTLQSNAAANAKKKREAASGGKFMKDVRRMSGT